MLASFNGNHSLLVGLGDGNLLTFTLNVANGAADPDAPPAPPGAAAGSNDPMAVDAAADAADAADASGFSLANRKKISLGTQPVMLTPFKAVDGSVCVFACCDRPTVIYEQGTGGAGGKSRGASDKGAGSGKIQYANVNVGDVNHMTPFHSEVSLFQHHRVTDSPYRPSDRSTATCHATLATLDHLLPPHLTLTLTLTPAYPPQPHPSNPPAPPRPSSSPTVSRWPPRNS